MDRKITEAHLAKTAKFLPKWKVVARLLDLESQTIKDIEDRYRDGENQRSEALMKWVNKDGPQSTYKKLYDILQKIDEGEAAEKVKELAQVHKSKPDLPPPSPGTHSPLPDASDPDPSQKSLPKSGEGSFSASNKNTRGQSDKERGGEIAVKKGDDFENVSAEQLGEDDLAAGAEHHSTPPMMPPAGIIRSLLLLLLILLGALLYYGENAYTRELKDKYSNWTPAKVDFPPVPTFSFTSLAIIKDTTQTKRSALLLIHTIQGSVDDVIEMKETIEYEDLFNNSLTRKNRVLLEGRPGCGKTTLTRKISKDWGEGVILSFVKYLFLIPLREFYNTTINLTSILEYYEMIELETEINGTGGKSVCFIFDGLDEYSQIYTRDGKSWFEKLLRGDVLKFSIKIITSRPYASMELRESVNTRGEVLGFLKEQIDQYINNSYPTNPSNAREVKKYLHDHQNIQHMCYVPLQLVMILFIYDTCEEEKTPLPKTETNVYNNFTTMSYVRYYKKKGKTIVLKDLKSIPPSEWIVFLRISRLAYNMTAASKTFISMQDINNEFLVSDVANLNIIVVDRRERPSGEETMLSFVHRTHQEFLAAYHLSTLPSDEQLQAIRDIVSEPHMEVVLKFFCGITGLLNIHWTEIRNYALLQKRNNMKVNLRALQCVFESQNDQRCIDLFSTANGTLLITNETLTLLDYYVVGHCLELASDIVKSISFRCQLTAEGLDIIVQNLILKHKRMEGVKELAIRDDLRDNDKLLALKGLFQTLPNLESLDLSSCFKEEGSYNWTLLGDLLKETPHLKRLDLGRNNLGPDGLRALWAARASLSNLSELNLLSCFPKGGLYNWTLLEDLLKETRHLQTLYLRYNHLGPNGLKALYEARTSLSNLRYLNLQHCFHEKGSYNWTLLGVLLEETPQLETLELSHYRHESSFNESRQTLIQKAKAGMRLDKDYHLQPDMRQCIPSLNHPTPNTTDDPPTYNTTATP